MQNNTHEIKSDFRCGYVVIIGEPNVGKSTLMNTLVGQKISIVTKKPQTTRHKILGILSSEEYQIIFLDTPGLLKPKYLLHNAMMEAAYSAIDDADIVIFIIDAQITKLEKDTEFNTAFQIVKKIKKPVFLVINKMDLIEKKQILPVIDFYSKKFPFVEIFPISALKSDGTNELLKSLVGNLPFHPPFYPIDSLSDANEKFFVSEIIREKIFELYRDEIPYSTTVDIVEYREKEGRKDFISAEIYVERTSQKGILIGKNGAALKSIGESARQDIEQFLDREVFLELHVKVREKWRDSKAWLDRLGYKSK